MPLRPDSIRYRTYADYKADINESDVPYARGLARMQADAWHYYNYGVLPIDLVRPGMYGGPVHSPGAYGTAGAVELFDDSQIYYNRRTGHGHGFEGETIPGGRAGARLDRNAVTKRHLDLTDCPYLWSSLHSDEAVPNRGPRERLMLLTGCVPLNSAISTSADVPGWRRVNYGYGMNAVLGGDPVDPKGYRMWIQTVSLDLRWGILSPPDQGDLGWKYASGEAGYNTVVWCNSKGGTNHRLFDLVANHRQVPVWGVPANHARDQIATDLYYHNVTSHAAATAIPNDRYLPPSGTGNRLQLETALSNARNVRIITCPWVSTTHDAELGAVSMKEQARIIDSFAYVDSAASSPHRVLVGAIAMDGYPQAGTGTPVTPDIFPAGTEAYISYMMVLQLDHEIGADPEEG